MRTMKHLALAASAAAALALAGCGGGGGGGGGTASAPAERKPVVLPTGTPDAYKADPGIYEIAADGSVSTNGVMFSCAVSACTVYVANDGKVTSRGGMVEAAHTDLLMALLDSEADLAAAQMALDTANADLTARQAELDMANADLTSTQADLDTANANLAAAQTALDTASQNLMDRQADLDTAKADLMAKEAELATAEALRMAKEAELNTANAALIAKQDELDTAKAALMAKQAEVDTAEALRMAKEEELAAAREDVQRLQEDNTATEGQRAAAQVKLDAAEADLADAEGNVAMLMADLETEQGKVAMLTTDLETEQGKVAMLTTDLEAEQGKVAMLMTDLEAEQGKVTMITGQLETAQGRVTELEGELTEAQGDVTELQGELTTAQGRVTELEGELTTANAEIARLQGLLDTARQVPQRAAIASAITALNSAIAAVDAGSSDADVKAADDALAAARKALADATHLPADERADRTAAVNGIAGQLATAKGARTTSIAAVTKETAITTEAAQTTDAELGGSDHVNADGTPGNADDPFTLAISRPRSGTEVKITDLGMNGDDDPKFMQAMNLGGGTTMHTRTEEANDNGDVVQEVVVVTTDIEAPKATPFMTPYPLDTSTDTTNDSPAPTNEGHAIDESVPLVVARVMSGEFTAGTAATLSFDFDDTSTTDVDEAQEVAGTYDGARGTYRCNGTALCTVTRANGEITAMSAGWVFIPATGATVYVDDANYLRYGFWLKKTTDEDGKVIYNEVETFAGAEGHGNSGDLAAVTGTATYTGGATGVYVHHVYSTGGSSIKSSTSGHFTAAASLTAHFDQPAAPDDNIPPNMLNTITGTIDNFMLSGGEANAWSVALSGDITVTTGTVDANMGNTAKGGVGNGSFTATFHGSTDDGNGAATVQPAAVTGEFNAGFRNGSVAGAFGANKDD